MPRNRNTKATPNSLPRGFRKTGSFRFNNQPCEILINSKSGELMFSLDGKIVEDPALQDELMQEFQKLNAINAQR